MATLIDLQSQIENLKKQAEEIRLKEFASTVAEIRSTMQAFGISIKDLQVAPNKSAKKAKTATTGKVAKALKGPKSGAKVMAKFKGPNGETWTGRGLTPKWLASLIAQGSNKTDFLVSPAIVLLNPPVEPTNQLQD